MDPVRSQKAIALSHIIPVSRVRVVDMPSSLVRTHLLRFGITPGTVIHCVGKLPLGPVIIKVNHQEIAIGRKLADSILVEPAN